MDSNLQPTSSALSRFRSGVFLHHSTGGRIWGPNGSTTSVPLEIAAYNLKRGLTGQDAFSLKELSWPIAPDNEWERWHRIFENQDTAVGDIRPILDANRIVIIKSCFPSSQILGDGSAADISAPMLKTVWNYKWHWKSILRAMRQIKASGRAADSLGGMLKTIWNYQWHWRSILEVMKQRPMNFFVIWTNAPLVASTTNYQQASYSDQFCRWAKDTLAQGPDPQFGPFPANVYVFDFFHKLSGADGTLRPEYAMGPSDSHPNALATQLVAPQLVSEVFDAALRYEKVISTEMERGG